MLVWLDNRQYMVEIGAYTHAISVVLAFVASVNHKPTQSI